MFALIWHNAALDELADAFVQADLVARDDIERAVTQLNSHLVADPTSLGESRPGRGRRIAFAQPCAILFIVDVAAGVVRVTHFWTY